MQTFVPLPDIRESARTLDRQRLGKQRVEALQIARAILYGGGWAHSPAAGMWRGYGAALCSYGMIICEEWIARGYRDTCLPKFVELYQVMLDAGESGRYPSWWGDESVHISHQSNLVRKDAAHYRQFFPRVDESLPYVWPVTTPDLTRKRKRGSVPRVAAGTARTESPEGAAVMAARNTSRKAKAKAAPAPVEDDEDLDDLETDTDVEEDEVEEAPKPKAKKAKAAPKSAKRAKASTDDDDEDEAPAKSKTKGIEAAQAARAAKAPKFGTTQLAEYVNGELGTEYTPFQLRAILRRMANDEDSSLSRVVGETRERYSFDGPEDERVQELLERLRSGEIEKDKKEQLEKLKARNEAKKGEKPAKASKKAKKEPEPVEDLDEDDEEDEDDE